VVRWRVRPLEALCVALLWDCAGQWDGGKGERYISIPCDLLFSPCAGFVVGHAGLLQALAMLLVAYIILALTVLSVCAIATNGAVRGGGAYCILQPRWTGVWVFLSSKVQEGKGANIFCLKIGQMLMNIASKGDQHSYLHAWSPNTVSS
jgi:hypothetical protein